MMNNQDVESFALIDLRNLDGIILEGESDEENGGDDSRRAKGPAVEDILKIHDKAMNRWNTLFIIVCAFSVFIDPLFCYIYVVREDRMCFIYDHKMLWTYIGLRAGVDLFYLIDIIILFCGICLERKGKIFWGFGKQRSVERRVLPLKEVIRKRYLLPLSILPRIWVALPIPAALILFTYRNRNFNPITLILIITPFQYTLRIFLIYGSQRWSPIKKTTTGRWLKPLLDFLPFILASYLFRALWYRLAVQRQVDCWKLHCKVIVTPKLNHPCSFNFGDFGCYYHNMRDNINTTRLNELCPTKASDPKVFDFGIFLYAVQSNVTGLSHCSLRISLSFWWALRNLSSFGSNLSTSMDILEIFFSGVISICGMMLFLVYLNARVQESQARSNQLKLKQKKHLMKPNIDLWLSKNDLANMKRTTDGSKDLKTVMKKKKALKTVIIENIDRLEENKDIDLQIIISVLPIKFKKSITPLLCLATLKKVPTLANLTDKMFKVICEHLKPVIYSEDNYIAQERKPLGMMFFITQGLAWSYTTNYINGGTSFDSSSNEWLKQGDFYGEELLNWAFKSPSFSALPISSRTVKCQEKVEAFALRASDLKSIVGKFWWHFTRELEQVDLEQWENLAASSIQGAWCNRLAKARRSNRWDKFSVEY